MSRCARCGHRRDDHTVAIGCVHLDLQETDDVLCPCPRWEQPAGLLLRAVRLLTR